MHEKMEDIGKSSAGVLTKYRSHMFDKIVFHFVMTRVKAKKCKKRETITCTKSNHAEKRSKAEAVLLTKVSNRLK